MSKYIDAEKLLKRWTVAESGTRFSLHDCDNFPITVTLKDVQNSIRNAPAADVEPVVHARWVDACVRDWHCSRCACEIQKIRHYDGYAHKDLPNYCPNCGAHMDEQEGK